MVEENRSSLSASSAFTLAAVVAFVTLWLNGHSAISTSAVDKFNSVRTQSEIDSFVQMIHPMGWLHPLRNITLRGYVKQHLVAHETLEIEQLTDLVGDMLLVFLKGPGRFLSGDESDLNWLQHLRPKANGLDISSLRSVLVHRLAFFAKDLPPVAKVAFLKHWIAHLNDQRLNLSLGTISLHQVPRAIENIEAQIFGEQDPHLPIQQEFHLLRTDRTKFILASQMRTHLPTLIEFDSVLFLNGVRLGNVSDFFSKFPPTKMIWASCQMPLVKDLGSLKVARVLWVQTCQPSTPDTQSYFDHGLKVFAHHNPDVAFVSFHIPSLRLARNWGAHADQRFQFGERTPSHIDRLMGLADTSHPVRGAIPAIEDYRARSPERSLRLIF